MISCFINFQLKKVFLLKDSTIENHEISLLSVYFTGMINIMFQGIILLSLSILNTKFVQA